MRIRAPRRPWYRSYLPGWWAFNPGSGGGAATVQTDGVTIQGDGSAGNKIAIKAVQTDGSLTGAGIVGSLLGQTPAIFYTNGGNVGSDFVNITQNRLAISGFQLYTSLTFAHGKIQTGTGDGGGGAVSSYGIYNPVGTLIAHITPITFGNASIITAAFVEGAQTIPPGLYFLGVTSTGTTLTIGQADMTWAPLLTGNYAVTTGGAQLASITPAAVSPVNSTGMLLVLY